MPPGEAIREDEDDTAYDPSVIAPFPAAGDWQKPLNFIKFFDREYGCFQILHPHGEAEGWVG